MHHVLLTPFILLLFFDHLRAAGSTLSPAIGPPINDGLKGTRWEVSPILAPRTIFLSVARDIESKPRSSQPAGPTPPSALSAYKLL